MDLEQLLAELAKKFGEAADEDARKAIVTIVKVKVKPLWQEAFNEGHGVATAQLQPKLDTAIQAKTTAEQAKKTAEDSLTEMQKKQPDTAKLHEDYGKKIQDKDAEIVTLKEQNQTDRLESRKSTALSRLRAELTSLVHEDYAEVLTQKNDVVKRFQFDDGSNLRIMQADGAIPYAGDDDAQVKAMAEELVKGTPDIFLRSNVSRGSGRESADGGTGGATKGKALYDGIRESVKAKAGTTVDPQKELHQRLGVTPPV